MKKRKFYYKNGREYYVPCRKWEMIDWLADLPGFKVWKLKKMKLEQLYAIYFKEREKLLEVSVSD